MHQRGGAALEEPKVAARGHGGGDVEEEGGGGDQAGGEAAGGELLREGLDGRCGGGAAGAAAGRRGAGHGLDDGHAACKRPAQAGGPLELCLGEHCWGELGVSCVVLERLGWPCLNQAVNDSNAET